MNISGNLFTMEGLMALAMDSEHMKNSKSQSGTYLVGQTVSGDKIEDKDNQIASVKGQLELVSFIWGHMKVIDKNTRKAALPSQIGCVMGVQMYLDAIPLLEQALYDGKPLPKLEFSLTNYTSAGETKVYGTMTHNNVRVSSIIYDLYTPAGPVAFIGMLTDIFETKVGNKMHKRDTSKEG
jgi:type VI protein secretion system component Hcp